jgi:hypothetical protein
MAVFGYGAGLSFAVRSAAGNLPRYANIAERARPGARLIEPVALACCIYLIFMTAETKAPTRASGEPQLFIHDTAVRSRSCP